MKEQKQSNLDQYWATLTDPDQLLDHLEDKIKNYYDDLRSTGLLTVWERSFRAYYGGRVGNYGSMSLFESSRLNQAGKQGEKTRLKANHYRNLLRHTLQLATQEKRNVQARATNTDYKSQSQTILANGLVEYYWNEKGVSDKIKDAVEIGLVYGEGFIHGPWDPNAGEIYTVDAQGLPIYEGDQKYELFEPINVIRDPGHKSDKPYNWVMIKSQENRWDLVTKYAESGMQEAIQNAPAEDRDEEFNPSFQIRNTNEQQDTDLVTVYTMYHGKTESMPQGRMVIFIRGHVVMFDGPLPYKNIPVFQLRAEKILGTIYGYSVAFDLLGLQEGIDELHTALMSNNKTFGVQSLWIKDTDKVQVSTIATGMKVWKSEEKPESLQLTASSKESYTYLDKLEHTQEQLSAISSTVRGNPEANLKSGNALALVVSQSIQFQQALDSAIDHFEESVALGLVDNLRDFSRTERVANIVGKSQRSMAKQFEPSNDLSEINRFVVEQVNPLSKTVAGRAEIANNLLQQGMIKDPQQYIMVLQTGQLDNATEDTTSEMLLIRAENESMRDSAQPPDPNKPQQPQQASSAIAVLTDNHNLHIHEHRCVLNTPEARLNPQLVQTVLQHIQEHIDLARSMDPALAMILGQQPLPPPVPGMPPMGQPVPQQGGGAPQGSNPMNPQTPTQQSAQGVPAATLPHLPPGSPQSAKDAYAKVQALPAQESRPYQFQG